MEALGGICLEEIYDGTGRHVAGLYPPLAINNVLTQVYHQTVAVRPFWQKLNVEPDGSNLALVWMVPLGQAPNALLPHEVVGALVQAVDAGSGVMVHADCPNTAAAIAVAVGILVGGGHA